MDAGTLSPAPLLYVIAVCCNEEEMIEKTVEELSVCLHSLIKEKEITENSRILIVDDGSSDHTWDLIKTLSKSNPLLSGIRLGLNSGHQNALMAGMEFAAGKCDAAITIDGDLQDDPSAIREMVMKYREGADLVLAVRENRKSDTWFKRNSASSFYRLMTKSGVDCVENHADYRLLSRRALDTLLEYGERNLFLRGIVTRLGLPTATVYYTRREREAGKSKYPLPKMVEFAVDGITSFSVKPVRTLFIIGLFFMLAALAIGIYTLIRHFSGETVEGWTSLILSIWFCTGILLMGMGVMGEYIGKIYIEVKKRPRYKIIEEI